MKQRGIFAVMAAALYGLVNRKVKHDTAPVTKQEPEAHPHQHVKPRHHKTPSRAFGFGGHLRKLSKRLDPKAVKTALAKVSAS